MGISNPPPASGGVSDGDKGDVIVSSTGAVWTVDVGVIGNTKLAQMTTKTYKGRTAGTTGDPEDVAVATLKTDLALGNVDNTTDANKPVSTAQQTALNLKANIAGPTFTGTVTVPGLTVTDATDFTISATTGSKLGQATSKLGFYGIAPAVRPTALTQTYSTASATHAAVTSTVMPAGGVGAAAGGWSTAANRDLAIAAFANDRTDLANLKNFVNQIVDQLQAIGLLQ